MYNFNIIKEFLTPNSCPCFITKKLDSPVLQVSDNFTLKDVSHCRDTIIAIQQMLKNNQILSDKGYINKPELDLPVTNSIVNEYVNINNLTLKDISNLSISVNILCNQLYMMYLYHLVVIIQDKYLILLEDLSTVDEDIDLQTDIQNVRLEILKTLIPPVKQLLMNKGLTLVSTSIVGYDSEYELLSSSTNRNSLLSIQLAGIHEILLKVPLTDPIPITIDYLSLMPLNKVLSNEKINEDILTDFLLNSLTQTIYTVRDML